MAIANGRPSITACLTAMSQARRLGGPVNGSVFEAGALEHGGRRAAIWDGLEPRPGAWRAAVPRPAVLPRYPVVTHRGGYPDGS